MYNRQYWQDHVTEHENRFRESNNPDGTINHIPVEGEILQQGTPQNATNFNNLETGVVAANELGAELVRSLLLVKRELNLVVNDLGFDAVTEYMAELLRNMLQHQRALNMVKGESGAVTLTNTLEYPFNNSVVSIPIKEVRDTTDYAVEIDTGTVRGVGRVVIFDKLKNGFKIAFTGGAASVAINYTVRGGLL